MHMADALVAPAVAATMYVCSGGVAGFSVKKVRLESDPKKSPVMGVMGAFVFAAQMINFTIPGTGSSGHLCGGMMLTALLGPYAAFLTMIGVLLIQCLLFADGGLLALGCNIWNMAFYGCFLGYFLFWRPMMKKGMSRGKIAGASILGCVATRSIGSIRARGSLPSGSGALTAALFHKRRKNAPAPFWERGRCLSSISSGIRSHSRGRRRPGCTAGRSPPSLRPPSWCSPGGRGRESGRRGPLGASVRRCRTW